MRTPKIVVLVVALAAGSLVATASASAASTRTLVVDDDRGQCPMAAFTAIQPAAAMALPGDTILVCGGTYDGDVTVKAGVSLVAHSPAAPVVDCLNGGGIGPDVAIITGEVALIGTGANLDGFVITGATTGVHTSGDGSGYQLRRNVIQDNARFGIELHSDGRERSVIERNCFRRNGINQPPGEAVGIQGDFGDLRNVVIRLNTSIDNAESISISGPFTYTDISISANVIRNETVAVAGLVGSEITGNDIDHSAARALTRGIAVGGGNVGLSISSNSITGAASALFFCAVCFNYLNANPNLGLLISNNTIRDGAGSGISMSPVDARAPVQITRSLFYRNTIQRNPASGVFLNAASIGNALIANTSTDNLRGVNLSGATGMLVLGNTLLRNSVVDAVDIASEQNTWIANRCATDQPAGTLCSVGPASASMLATTADARSRASAVIPARPAVDQARWPCLRVPVWDPDQAGGGWVWLTVTASPATPGTTCQG